VPHAPLLDALAQPSAAVVRAVVIGGQVLTGPVLINSASVTA
jgi:hypothetical protein